MSANLSSSTIPPCLSCASLSNFIYLHHYIQRFNPYSCSIRIIRLGKFANFKEFYNGYESTNKLLWFNPTSIIVPHLTVILSYTANVQSIVQHLHIIWRICFVYKLPFTRLSSVNTSLAACGEIELLPPIPFLQTLQSHLPTLQDNNTRLCYDENHSIAPLFHSIVSVLRRLIWCINVRIELMQSDSGAFNVSGRTNTCSAVINFHHV